MSAEFIWMSEGVPPWLDDAANVGYRSITGEIQDQPENRCKSDAVVGGHQAFDPERVERLSETYSRFRDRISSI